MLLNNEDSPMQPYIIEPFAFVPWHHHDHCLFILSMHVCFRNDSILIDTDRMIFTPVLYHYQICNIFMKLLHYILFLCCYDS